ncbi:hypothetical protein FIBSPDRAFT_931752 [Athelia psychrophila]|uniref:Ubiquitin-like domain-containing protein n=1 Tax=Athelia psychrophila TaxID=1759441 RepID=A0A166JYN1_9AGAM|nr:hypothetical protein FIBSPDRAFT_931752 [Fibularhizoctonia sp. CBS 109695]
MYFDQVLTEFVAFSAGKPSSLSPEGPATLAGEVKCCKVQAHFSQAFRLCDAVPPNCKTVRIRGNSAEATQQLGELVPKRSSIKVGAAEHERRIPGEVEVREEIVSDMPLEANDVSCIVPSSKVPTIALELAREDGDEVDTPLEMQDDKTIAIYSPEGQTVLVNVDMNIPWEAVSESSVIGILVSIDDRIQDAEGSRVGVTVSLGQTLGSFKELLSNEHSFHCAENSLILNGCELKDNEQTLGDLGFVEGCTVHAVAAVQFSVATLSGKEYKFALKTTTLISEIRKLLREMDADNQDDYAFSLDGVNTLPESQVLWDLNRTCASSPSPSNTSASLPISTNASARNSMTKSPSTAVRVSTTSERKF